ncbi:MULTISPECIES: DUF1404 domain-containing protein [Metallosphaera]|uniref:DUF1404 domain-containing protein n=1 Tax=Metallosphaera TaxID=41980 RepID=UPI001F054DEA|nr:DUF1404 domain-containing protein [Metallosphaera sedula]MCH1771085.1 DUF1404 domain-containing protein [Metallosphaera sedula]MCP6729456.1 DUF1404 domain-containing protein [Metallosphaera sedula]
MKGKTLFLGIFLVLLIVNPLFEEIYGKNAVLYMASHYALFALGMWIGLAMVSRKYWVGKLVVGSGLAVLAHIPLIFDVSAYSEPVRLILELGLVLGGFLVGSSFQAGGNMVGYILLGGWMAGDTALSIAFLLGDSGYTFPSSPYPTWQIKDAGMFMFLLTNVVAFFIIMRIFIRFLEKGELYPESR